MLLRGAGFRPPPSPSVHQPFFGYGYAALWDSRLCHNPLDNLAAEIGQLLVTAVVQEPKLILIHPQQVQNRGMEIAHVISVALGAQTQLVGLPDCPAALRASAGEPHGEAVRIVVAA